LKTQYYLILRKPIHFRVLYINTWCEKGACGHSVKTADADI